MDLLTIVEPGVRKEVEHHVTEEQTAVQIGSGASRVLATPWMIALMERASHQLLAERLPPGFSSVGVEVHVRHLAPTPVGSRMRIAVEVTDIQGLKVTFQVQAWDAYELVGEGEHQRFVIEESRFQKRVTSKRQE
jgi:fluoroacetyl-CoA thioesterase